MLTAYHFKNGTIPNVSLNEKRNSREAACLQVDDFEMDKNIQRLRYAHTAFMLLHAKGAALTNTTTSTLGVWWFGVVGCVLYLVVCAFCVLLGV